MDVKFLLAFKTLKSKMHRDMIVIERMFNYLNKSHNEEGSHAAVEWEHRKILGLIWGNHELEAKLCDGLTVESPTTSISSMTQ